MADVTAILTTYTADRLDTLDLTLRSLRHAPFDVLGVFDDDELADWFDARDDTDRTVRVDALDGLADARNVGAAAAETPVYAFLDDDVEVLPGWYDALDRAFGNDHLAAGGPALPEWPNARPSWLAPEWDWLVGCGPYHREPCEVRNSYGCNLAIAAEAFDALDGFDVRYGKKGDLDQGEEAELCRRLGETYGVGVQFDPAMAVRHHVFEGQLRVGHVLRRAFAQGRSKARMGIDDTETGFLRDAIVGLRRQPFRQAIGSTAWLSAVGWGFVAGKTL